MRIEVNGLTEVMKKLDKLSDKGRVDDIAKKAVNAALPALESSVRSHVHPSDVAGSVVAKKAKVNQYGVFGVATLSGHNKRGESNTKRANILEYGRKRGNGARNPHKPWRAASANAAESACVEAVKNVVEAEMELE